MKAKITAIMLSAMIVLLAGTSVAYYNTKTFAFDEDAVVFSRDDEKISFMDYDIYYDSLDNLIKKVKIVMPAEHYCI
ncbi:MAG: hypothetical protein J1E81_09675 [Eubacterium sp.]|nr:hypothetical protein [Eubacterium sp.]